MSGSAEESNANDDTQLQTLNPDDVDWARVIANHEQTYAEGTKIREYLATLFGSKLKKTTKFDVCVYTSFDNLMDVCQADFPRGLFNEYYKDDRFTKKAIINMISRNFDSEADINATIEEAFQRYWDQSIGAVLVRDTQNVRLAFFQTYCE